MDVMILAILGLVVMFILIVIGMNVAVAMFIVGFVGLVMLRNWSFAVGIIRQVPFAQASTYAFTVIPMFVLMGNAAFKSGLSDGLFDASKKWLNRLPGNMACSSALASAVFGAICGSSIATVVTIGTVALPKMREANYSDKIAIGVITVSGGLGILVPPSSPMIIYGVATETSIGRLFAAGIFPGILCTALIIIQIVVMVKINPALAPAGSKSTWSERLKSLKQLSSVIVLFLVVLGGMFSGVFTVNEAAAIGAVASILLMVAKRKMNWENFKSIISDTINATGIVFLLMVGAAVLGSFLAISKLPMLIANLVSGLEVSRYVIFAFIILFYLILGCIIDVVPMILLTMQIFYPIAMNIGFDSVWFGVIVILVAMIGYTTPPVGLLCFVVAGLDKSVPLYTVFRCTLPFIIPLLLTLVIITVFPQVALWLPNLLYSP